MRAFQFHHVVKENVLEPVEYPIQAQLALNGSAESDEHPLDAIQSESKKGAQSTSLHSPNCDEITKGVAALETGMVGLETGDTEMNILCKQEDLREELHRNSLDIGDPVDLIPQSIGTGDNTNSMMPSFHQVACQSQSASTVPSTSPLSQWPSQELSQSSQATVTPLWPQIPPTPPIPPGLAIIDHRGHTDSYMTMPSMHPAYYQFLALWVAQHAQGGPPHPGLYPPIAPFPLYAPFTPPIQTGPSPPFTPPLHHQQSMDPTFGNIDPLLIPPGDPPFSSPSHVEHSTTMQKA